MINDKINKLKEQEEGDIEIIKKSLSDTRETLIIKTDKLNEQNENYHKNNYENMKSIIKEIEAVNGSINGL